MDMDHARYFMIVNILQTKLTVVVHCWLRLQAARAWREGNFRAANPENDSLCAG